MSLISTPKAISDTHLGGKLIGLVSRVQAFLSDNTKSSVVVVALPEPLVMGETVELLANLRQTKTITCGGVFLNRMLVESDHSVDDRTNPWIREYIQNRMKEQHEAVVMMQKSVQDDRNIVYLSLADCGYVHEPMPDNMADILFHIHVQD